MTIEKITGAISPTEETAKINEVIDEVNYIKADYAKVLLVNELPENPDSNVWYAIPEEQEDEQEEEQEQ